jgi:hypothetical protein
MRFHIILSSKQSFLVLNNAVMRFSCFNDTKIRRIDNRSLENCLILYQFINLELFHPEHRNIAPNDTRFHYTGEKFIFLISRF